MSNGPHDGLTDALSRAAEQFDRRGGTEVGLDQVIARAGEIRRGRRLRATIVMAACVLAVAAPVGVVALQRTTSSDPQPAPPSQVDTSPLTINGLAGGDPPSAYLRGGRLVSGNTTTPLPQGRPTAFASFRGGVVVATQTADGTQAQVLDAEAAKTWPVDGDFSVSDDETMVAFVRPDGTPVVLESDDQGNSVTAYELPRVQRGSGFDAVAVTGQDCRPGSGAGCSVWVTSSGASPESWVSTSDGIARKTSPMFRTLTDVVEGKLLAGIVDVREDLTTCSAVERFTESTPLWRTCDHRLVSFSPDDARLLATGSVGDGLGDTQLATLDSQSGEVDLDLRTTAQAFISQMVWEDDSHVLATVFEDNRWAVVRIGMDGTREYAVEPVAGEDIDPPFVLASR